MSEPSPVRGMEEHLLRDVRAAPRDSVMPVVTLLIGICTFPMLLWVGIGNAIGAGAGVTGIVVSMRYAPCAPGRMLCLIGAALNALMLFLVAAGSAVLVNCVGI